MPTNAKSFAAKLRQHGEERPKQVFIPYRTSVAIDLMLALVQGTPIDEGPARAAWHLTVGEPSNADISSPDPVMQAAQAISGATEIGDQIWIQNQVGPEVEGVGKHANSACSMLYGRLCRAAREVGYPVVIKILSPDISHKSDVNGVVLNLRSATAVRDAASEFNAVDLIDRRGELQQRMAILVRGALLSTLQGRGVPPGAVVVDNILIRNIDLPNSIDEAIANVQRQRQVTAASTQANLTAQQEAARALTVANGEAAALIARTRADAEMLTIRTTAQANANRALSASLTPEFLQYERIQATKAVLASNQTRTVFLNGGMSPNMLMSAPQ